MTKIILTFVLIASGQTGSGKTFTMMGKTDENSELQFEERGIIPRAFEYLFILMEREKNKVNFYYC